MTEAEPRIDWHDWHADYDTDTPLRRRLEIVQRRIVAMLERSERSPLRVISMCAGEGRDLLGALSRIERRDVRGRLVELDPQLAAIARARARELGLAELEVVVGDAGRTAAYRGAVPADLVLVCGVFGNISDDDVQTTVSVLPELCASGATMIWTRHRRPPDLTPRLRHWLSDAGFEEISFERVPDSPGSVGVACFVGQARTLTDRQLFTFIRTQR
ncbi:MAG TPA: class I SAM-dependent methyltransferase family protein [Candidatus Limnocylindrales bacterium]|nr:class I SAM-dependent methyltransferase family protein [Candidatus Limnocylindrales bacterium]